MPLSAANIGALQRLKGAKNSRKEGGLENEIDDQEAMDSEGHQGDAVASIERGCGVRAFEEGQPTEIIQCVDGHDGDEYEPEGRRKQREPLVHRLEQVIEDERYACVAGERDHHLRRGSRRSAAWSHDEN